MKYLAIVGIWLSVAVVGWINPWVTPVLALFAMFATFIVADSNP